MGGIYRGRDRDHNKVSPVQLGWIIGHMQMAGYAHVGDRDFSSGVHATPVTLDFAAGKIIPDGLPFLSKLYCEG
jgi:hypothetical protein